MCPKPPESCLKPWLSTCMLEAPSPRLRGRPRGAGQAVGTFACFACLLVHLVLSKVNVAHMPTNPMLCLLVQMPANHGVDSNSPLVAFLKGAYRQTRPEAKIYENRLKNTYSETPGGSGRPSGGPRKATRWAPEGPKEHPQVAHVHQGAPRNSLFPISPRFLDEKRKF